MNANNPAAWQARPEAGSLTGLAILRWVAARLGRRALLWVLYPITAYFYFIRTPERRASRDYLRRVFGRGVREREVFKHFYSFARMTADRFFFLAGRVDEIPLTFQGGADAQRVVDSGRTGIFLAAHLGSFEAARVVGPQLGGINLRIVLDAHQGGQFVEMMQRINPEMTRNIIDSEQGSVALGLAIGDAIKAGDWVGFLADRYRAADAGKPADRTVVCDFLGAPARIPLGPYLIANTFKAPIICAFCRLTDQGYDVHCEVLSEGLQIARSDRAQALAELAARYAQRLEFHVRAAPYSWFNFYDFWTNPDD